MSRRGKRASRCRRKMQFTFQCSSHWERGRPRPPLVARTFGLGWQGQGSPEPVVSIGPAAQIWYDSFNVAAGGGPMKHCLEFARRARWIITIGMLWLAGASVAVAAPFDIVSSQKDQNGALLNPVWEWQLTHPDQLPDNSAGQICQGHSWESPCTSQPIDANDPILGDPYCEGGQGHRNWGVATFTGVAFWDEHSDDDDYNIDLYRPDH